MSSPADNFNEEQTRALLGEFRKLIGAGDDKFADTVRMAMWSRGESRS